MHLRYFPCDFRIKPSMHLVYLNQKGRRKMRLGVLIVIYLHLLCNVFAALPPDHQSARLILPYQTQDGAASITRTNLSSTATVSSIAPQIINASFDSNSTVFIDTSTVFFDPSVICFTQPSAWIPQYKIIVLEDCQRIFTEVLVQPDIVTPKLFNPSEATLRSHGYRKQSGNCVFTMLAYGPAKPEFFSELEIIQGLARVVDKCVRAQTGYLGGQREMDGANGWFLTVVADPIAMNDVSNS